MDYSMSKSSPHSRKRSIRDVEEDDHDLRTSYAGTNAQDTATKRLQNSQGKVIERRPVKYDAQKLLNNLAFTDFYVTENFANYDPKSSFIIVCMVSEQNDLYRALCQILPSLYTVCPTLQALAITTGYINPNAMADQKLRRILPLLTAACVEASVVDELEQFRDAVGGPEGCIAAIDAFGNCAWTSTEFVSSRTSINDGCVDLPSLQRSLAHALGNEIRNLGDVAMGDG